MCLFNSRSIVNKLSNLQSFVYSSNYTIYCITETWLTESVSDFEILPGNFSIFRMDRGSRGGGVLIAVDASVPCSVVSSPSNLEVVIVKIGFNSPLFLCTVYVPPSSSDGYQISLVGYLSE